MPELDTPQGAENDGPLSMDEAIKAFSREPEDEEPDEGHTESEDSEDDAETLEYDQDDDQDVDEEADDEGQADDDGEDDEQEDFAQGRFASDDAKVRLEDGTTVTIAELKRGSLREADYTRKTMEVAEQRKAVEAQVQRVQQLEQEISQNREVLQFFASQLMPQEPDPAMMASDPMGYFEAKAAFDQQAQRLNQLSAMQQAELARQQQQSAEAQREQRRQEAERLISVMPELRDRERYGKFMQTGYSVMSEKYGLQPEEFQSMAADHRFYPMMRDLAAYHRTKANTAGAKAKTEGKPPVLRPGKRKSREAQRAESRKAAFDRLNRSGKVQDGVAALLALEKG